MRIKVNDIKHQRKLLAAVSFPDGSRFYDHLAEDVQSAIKTAKQDINSINLVLDQLKNALERKKASPFDSLLLDKEKSDGEAEVTSLLATIVTINSIIAEHEATTKNLKNEINKACQALEQDYVLGALSRFDELNSLATDAEKTFTATQRKPGGLEEKIRSIERDIVEHRRPAEELNNELHAYLGRNELIFTIKDTGYALMRDGKPAFDLSEGERTAIAFLYFLKSLEDNDFDLSNGIVVIDDPVSSLDANALFSAFGYMKERTKECHQLFILTHNFAFFRLVKNWFHHLTGQRKPDFSKRPARFYSLWTTLISGERNAILSRIDPLLEQFESEYHFLFRQVYDLANYSGPDIGLEDYYGMPNIARRLIETFLAYRFPEISGQLSKQIDRVKFDPAKKTRILRLLHTYSHAGGVSVPEHDPTILTETREVMKELLELIEAVDGDHYQGMMTLVQTKEIED
ncbi:MAG: hypothetical protein DRH08_09830 [Deltaproteobacteria bacterium]|nr:MAG: hypothetical protein DRH08_09830 [Deltaproteobacteria bacterium]